jgi:hypothetical protein
MKLNYLRIKNLVKIYKQIEMRDGLVFMRARKKPFVIVSQVN